MNTLKKYILTVLFCSMIFVGCRADDLSKKNFKDLLPDVIGPDELRTVDIESMTQAAPETTFQDATYLEIEEHYKRILARGGVYFLGYDLPLSDSPEDNKSLEPERHTIFVTGDLHDQLTTIALKFGGRLYELNDDYYILRDSGEAPKKFDVSSVFVSTVQKEQILELLKLYDLSGYTVGLQTVVKGPLLDIVAFKKTFDALEQNKGVYLIDLAFIDFTIQEATEFEAYLVSNPVDLLSVRDFSDLFSMYLHVSVDNLRSRNFYSNSLLASDGNPSTFNVGSSHSREERAITDQGTSTVQRYEDVKDGFQLTFTPQNCVENCVFCTLSLENSAFQDDDYLTKQETKLDFESVPFVLGKTYYLSSLSNIVKKRQFYLFGLGLSSGHRVQTIWARVRKIK